MSDPESEPKLRIIDEDERASEEIVRLSRDGESVETVARLELPKAPEKAERIEVAPRDNFDGRTHQPGMEAILDGPESQTSVETDWEAKESAQKSTPFGWFVLIALLVGGAGFMAYQATQQGKEKVQQVKQEEDNRQEDDKARSKEANVLIGGIQSLLTNYVAARSIDEMLPYVRQPERVRPLMEDWYRRHPIQPQTFKQLGTFGGITFRRVPFWRADAELADGNTRELLLEQTSDIIAKVDWETDVYYQPMDWDQYVKERTADKAYDFRILVAPDSYYSHEFADEEKFACFRMAATGGDYLFGYCAKGGLIEKALMDVVVTSPEGIVPVYLRLRVPPGVKSQRGVVIESVLATNWILVGDEEPVMDPQ